MKGWACVEVWPDGDCTVPLWVYPAREPAVRDLIGSRAARARYEARTGVEEPSRFVLMELTGVEIEP